MFTVKISGNIWADVIQFIVAQLLKNRPFEQIENIAINLSNKLLPLCSLETLENLHIWTINLGKQFVQILHVVEQNIVTVLLLFNIVYVFRNKQER